MILATMMLATALQIKTDAEGMRYAEGLLRGEDGVGIYTVGALPEAGRKCDVSISRSPYIRKPGTMQPSFDRVPASNIVAKVGGMTTIRQHCRGHGASEGLSVPYEDERQDGLALLDWVRKQDFYNGRILLTGGSYGATVHFAYLDTDPKDVIGATLTVQDCNRYNILFRNGMFKTGLHGTWYKTQFHEKAPNRKYDDRVRFEDFPLIDFHKRWWGSSDPSWEMPLRHYRADDPFWRDRSQRSSGAETREAMTKSTMPVMMRTGFYDIYTEGVCDMWRSMSRERRANCALIIDAYDHGGKLNEKEFKGTLGEFPNGDRAHYGKAEQEFVAWCRDRTKAPKFTGFELGKTSYFALWENKWYIEDELRDGPRKVELSLPGADEVGWTYDPKRGAPTFPGSGGICFGGMRKQPAPNFRDDVKSFVLPPIKERLDVRGRMTARLAIRSDCEDTGVYIRVSVNKGDGLWYLLRDDIKPLTYDDGAYRPGEVREVRFRFPDHAFRLEPGDVLRVDVACAGGGFQLHPNVPGNPSLAREPRVAHNAVVPSRSVLVLPVLK